MATESSKSSKLDRDKTHKCDVIIIGAGLSGLSAARTLSDKHVNVTVLEARGRVGGRTMTKVDISPDNHRLWVDLGGSYVGPTQNDSLALIEELGLGTYLVEDTLDVGYMKVNESKRIVRRARNSPDVEPSFGNIFHWLDYVNTVAQIDSMGAEIPADAPWQATKAAEWDSMTVKQFLDSVTYTKNVRDFFSNIMVPVDVCCEPAELSLLWFLWYVKQCGGYGRSMAITNGGQERKINGGSQQLSEGLRLLVGQQKVLLNKAVHKLEQDAHSVVVTALDGSKYSSKFVIFATPPHLWLKIHHEPPLPAEKNLLAQRSPMGQVTKLILYYETAFWKPAGYGGCFMIDGDDAEGMHPVVMSLDETKIDGSFPAIICFISAHQWYKVRGKTDEELGKIVAQTYTTMTGLSEFEKFVRVERQDWTQEQYSGGCYTSTHGPKTLTKYGRYIREPFGRVHYAGTETATKWSGYMDGALSAGKRAAREILVRMGKLEESEVWHEEPESRLVPATPFKYPASYKWAPSIKSLLVSGHSLVVLGVGLSILLGLRAKCHK